MSRLILYFSLPFTQKHKRGFFFNGHIALQAGGDVYQIFNPELLKSPFLISRMPVNAWLYDAAVKWVERSQKSPYYRWVNLYGKAETERTAVYALAREKVPEENIAAVHTYFADLEHEFEKGRVRFSILWNNCINLLAPVLKTNGFLPAGYPALIPVLSFKKAVSFMRETEKNCSVYRVPGKLLPSFKTQPFCIGLCNLSAEKHMDGFIRTICTV